MSWDEDKFYGTQSMYGMLKMRASPHKLKKPCLKSRINTVEERKMDHGCSGINVLIPEHLT
jgi:hypothetical protein